MKASQAQESAFDSALMAETLAHGQLIRGSGFSPYSLSWGSPLWAFSSKDTSHKDDCTLAPTESSEFSLRSVAQRDSLTDDWSEVEGYELAHLDCGCGQLKDRTVRWEPSLEELTDALRERLV